MELTTEQTNILVEIFQDFLKTNDKLYQHSEVQNGFIETILRKANQGTFHLSKDELIFLAHFTSDFISEFARRYNAYNLKFWINITEEVFREMIKKDLLIDILSKSNIDYLKDIFHHNLAFRSSNVLGVIQKLKECNTVLLSSITDPYKIGFVYQFDEILVLEFKHSFDIADQLFYKFTNYHDVKNSFFGELTRQDAYKVISKCDLEKYPSDNIDFLLYVLQ